MTIENFLCVLSKIFRARDYSEGYRPTGMDFSNSTNSTSTFTFEAERLKNHEIWVRSHPTDRLSLDGSMFYYLNPAIPK